MEVHRQQCQKCGSRELVNYLVRESGTVVYVSCHQCKHLVARYRLEGQSGYFHIGRGFDSFLRNLSLGEDLSSARELRRLFEETEEECLEEFKLVLKQYESEQQVES